MSAVWLEEITQRVQDELEYGILRNRIAVLEQVARNLDLVFEKDASRYATLTPKESNPVPVHYTAGGRDKYFTLYTKDPFRKSILEYDPLSYSWSKKVLYIDKFIDRLRRHYEQGRSFDLYELAHLATPYHLSLVPYSATGWHNFHDPSGSTVVAVMTERLGSVLAISPTCGPGAKLRISQYTTEVQE